jgi:hypothetical protein
MLPENIRASLQRRLRLGHFGDARQRRNDLREEETTPVWQENANGGLLLANDAKPQTSRTSPRNPGVSASALRAGQRAKATPAFPLRRHSLRA